MRGSAWGRWGLVALGVALGACTPERGEGDGGGGTAEVSQASVQADVEASLEASLGGLARALAFLDESELMGLLPQGEAGECVSDGSGEVWCDDGGSEGLALGASLEEGVSSLVRALREDVLTEDRIEEQSATSIVYLIPAEQLCGMLEESGEAPRPVEPDREGGAEDVTNASSSCVEAFTAAPLRVRATSSRAGSVLLEVLIGSERANPLDVSLTPRSAELELDLGEAKRALQALAAGADESIELPEVMQGAVSVRVDATGGESFTGSVSIVRPIEVLSMSLEHPLALRLGRAEPAVELSVDGASREVTARLDVGTVDITGDMGMFWSGAETTSSCYEDWDTGEIICDEAEIEEVSPFEGHTLAVHLGGASLQATYAGEEDRIALTDLGLGDDRTHLDVDGQTFFGLDVNATRGRRFDLTVEAGESGVEVAVSPALEVAVELDMRHMPDASEGGYPSWALDETLVMSLDGSSPRLLLEESGAARVLSGTLKLRSAATGRTLTANTNQCIWAEEVEEAEHLFDGLEAGACPAP